MSEHGTESNGAQIAEWHLYTDGACQPNPGQGGWAFLLKRGETEFHQKGSVPNTTNNRMELQAVLEGFRFFAEEIWTGRELLILWSDSQYTVKGINLWSAAWAKKGWRKGNNQPVLNDDIWRKIFALKEMIKPECRHIRGHTGHEENELVDQLAVEAIVHEA